MNAGIKEGEEGRGVEGGGGGGGGGGEEEALSSGLEIERALEWLDFQDGGEAVDGALALHRRRRSVHGGPHPHALLPMLQPLYDRSQKLSTHFCAFPLEVLKKGFMSSTGTASIQESVRNMSIAQI